MSNSTDRGVIFDWDGVIVDSHDLHERSWQALAAQLGVALPDGFFKATFGMRNQQIIPEFTDWARPDQADRIAELAGTKESLYRALVRREGIAVFPGVIELLDSLAAAGVAVGIGSSAPRDNLELALARLGLRSRFAAIIAAEDVARGKPDPEVFLRCARGLARQPAHCTVIEDAPAGIVAARAAGMAVIAVTTTHAAPQLEGADTIVESLADLRPFPGPG